MAENQEGNTNIIENLALITDAMQTLFPDGKMICLYELNEDDYKKIQQNFRKIDHFHNKFSIDISGLEHVFVNEKFNNNLDEEPKEESKIEEKDSTKSFSKKVSSWFERGGGPVK
jgi:hypothetical protein